MGNPVSPLVGFNNNVKHRGKIFHIQTEDSGVKHPHIVTHLFADGGRIVKSTRTDYAEHIDRPDMVPLLRRLMKDQHKAMFIALRDGSLDHLIFSNEPPASSARPTETKPKAPPLPSRRQARGARSKRAGPGRPPPAPPATDENVELRQRPPSRELSRMVPREPKARAKSSTAPRPGLARPTPVLGSPQRNSESARYAATRPSAIFGGAPAEQSLFGGVAISEQSLDEVILSYLSEELDESTTGE